MNGYPRRGRLPSPREIPLDPISSLSGFLLGPLTSADVTLLHFSRFNWRNAKRRVRVRSARERERPRGEGWEKDRGEDTIERRRSRNELRVKEGDGEYPRARQHDYEPQLCLRRLPATQRSSGTVDHESSSDDPRRVFAHFLYQI